MLTNDDTDRRAIPLLTFVGRTLGRFRRDQKGATAVEFALVAIVFFPLLFAILETGLIFLMGQALETATENSARLIRTGQAQEQDFDEDAFRNSICYQLKLLPSCSEKLILDVRTAANFGSTDLSTPMVNGELDDEGFGYEAGHGEEIVVVRAFYEWPTIAGYLSSAITDLSNGNHLMVATAAFRNEPFPW
jgi:Flp pilus assembly protein TadG